MSGNMRQWLIAVAVLGLLQLAIVSTTSAAPPAGGWGGDGGGCNSYHRVQYGETLYSIGRRYGVTPQRIAQANGLQNVDHIYAGQVLHIPCGDGYQQPSHPDKNPCCDSGMGGHYRPQIIGYGYDFTGYYYETYYPNYQRYSYTCGYHYNCY